VSTTTPTASPGAFGDVQGEGQGGDHAPVRGEHRVQRLDREAHPGVQRVRNQVRDRPRDPPAGAVEVAPAQSAAHEHQRGRAQAGRLVDGAVVVVEPVVALEETAPAQRADGHVGRAQVGDRAPQAVLLGLFAPQTDPADAGRGAAIDDLRGRPPVRGRPG
jgi:hypothetical protein